MIPNTAISNRNTEAEDEISNAEQALIRRLMHLIKYQALVRKEPFPHPPPQFSYRDGDIPFVSLQGSIYLVILAFVFTFYTPAELQQSRNPGLGYFYDLRMLEVSRATKIPIKLNSEMESR